jgi:hypothetical protein
VALGWEVLLRLPLVLNAATHLDSDLAVDGLTLLEAVQGHWRWHYPGTPAIGTIPVLLSWPLAVVWGASPGTLIAGGTVAYALLTIAAFWMAWSGFGPGVAGWSLIPLVFASTGTLWLSCRITGGHVLTAAWHAGAFGLLYQALVRGGIGWAAGLGLFCGLGLYLDAMFVTTLLGLVPAGIVGWWVSGPTRRGLWCGLVAALAFLAGAAPHEVGRRLEPHDAYPEQFRPVRSPDVLNSHARLLVEQCLPRLIVGHRLPGLQADPDPRALAGPGPTSSMPDKHPAAAGLAVVGLTLFLAALVSLAFVRGKNVAAWAVCLGLLISAAAVAVGFVMNWNIYNSDNYRYLVTLLVPWALGFGLTMQGLARRGQGGLAVAWLGALVLAGLMTYDSVRWYARFGWIDAQGRPLQVIRSDPVLEWLDAHHEVTAVTGDYWDVYRLAFLTAGRVRGVPLPIFPNRFPEWSRDLPAGRARVLVVRATREGFSALQAALRAGGRVLYQARGISIVSAPGN